MGASSEISGHVTDGELMKGLQVNLTTLPLIALNMTKNRQELHVSNSGSGTIVFHIAKAQAQGTRFNQPILTFLIITLFIILNMTLLAIMTGSHPHQNGYI